VWVGGEVRGRGRGDSKRIWSGRLRKSAALVSRGRKVETGEDRGTTKSNSSGAIKAQKLPKRGPSGGSSVS